MGTTWLHAPLRPRARPRRRRRCGCTSRERRPEPGSFKGRLRGDVNLVGASRSPSDGRWIRRLHRTCLRASYFGMTCSRGGWKMEGHPVAGHTVQTAEEWCVLRESDSFVVCLARVPYVYFTVSRNMGSSESR